MICNRSRCECPEGYTGADCAIKIDHCEISPCSNNGNCVNHVGNYTCDCHVPFAGRNCEIGNFCFKTQYRVFNKRIVSENLRIIHYLSHCGRRVVVRLRDALREVRHYGLRHHERTRERSLSSKST